MGVNLWVALAAWIGVSVPVSLALGILLGRSKSNSSATDRISLPSVSARRLTRV